MACSLSHPPALRDADYRLAPVIVLPLLIVVSLMVGMIVIGEVSRSASAVVVILILRVLLYIGN